MSLRNHRMVFSIAGVSAALLLVAGASYNAGRQRDEGEAAKPKEPVAYTINVNPEQKQPTSAAYLAIAKNLIAIGDEGSALPFLERAALLDGPEQKEAADLLAKTLAKRSANSSDSQKSSVAYSSSMSPQEVVRGYLSAATWQQRLPFVLSPKTVGPLMAIKYRNVRLQPEKEKAASFLPLDKSTYEVGEKLTVTADMSESSPSMPYWNYAVVKTAEGYKVDWETSQSLQEKEQQAIAMRALQLENPVIEATILKSYQQYTSKYSSIDIRLTNRSNKVLAYYSVTGEAYDRNKIYIARNMKNGTMLKAGESRTETMTFETNGVDMGSWKLSLENVDIETIRNGQVYGSNRIDASKYFTLRVVNLKSSK